MLEGWVHNGDVKIHYLDNTGSSDDNTPLVIIPGMAEIDEDYEDILQALLPRRGLVITMRGRGKSDTPAKGYTLEDHVSDIESVINHIEIDDFVLFGYARGVSYALGYAVSHPDRMKGLIIGDYPPIQANLEEGWAEFFAAIPYRKRPVLDRISMATLKQIEKDSRDVNFTEALQSLNCPILVLRGTQQGAGLTEDGVKEYLLAVPDANIREFNEEGEDLFHPSTGEFVQRIEEFFEEIDE
ncbi:alpha/beta fold hydrolase [Bacillus sp. V59.32b]|uniref:alpha/beta fold hydrolase n=1 Tax=Bacillus sp. V59.32b TaxID=1758642 RepID=UPI000E3D1FED|nr:alpha/beta hydrolase [Bacillus sp. V59.32b]RFU69991.1 alpha/beta hydrolase [Bacillus sp. V59.32b]